MRKYSAYASTVLAADKDAISLYNTGTSCRMELDEVSIGVQGTPTDAMYRFLTKRITTTGTGTDITPDQADALDGTPLGDAKHTITANGTTTGGVILPLVFHRRGGCRWIATSKRIIIPSVANSGLGFRHDSNSETATPTVDMCVWWLE